MVTFEDGQQKADEKSIWHLLVRDFYWIPPDNAVVKVLPSRRKSEHGKVKFQLFEVMFATLMAELRSDYQWFVSPNRADEGTDFIGRSQFLQSEALGIAASITVGGQCKKREKVNDIVQEVGGSLLRMAMAENPTFFIVALAANLEKKRIGDAKGIIEHTHKRECQILERRQIEALFSSHMAVMHPLLVEALDSSEIEQVLAYFRGRSLQNSGLYEISAKAPERVLAGEPFIVDVEIRGMIEPDGGLRLRWRCGQSDGDTGITLVGPLGADHTAGAPVERSMTKDDNPMVSRVQLQLVS
ncbi:MAG TPA: hypothetical protein VFQ45_16775, partial [Longimicrobium sp.]|nr:hypothetical protein [Longimicrobium sp.]